MLTLKIFHTFSQHFTVEFGKCYRLGLPTEIRQVKIMKHVRTGVCHIILTKLIKLQLKSKHLQNLLTFLFCKGNYFKEKKRNENHLMCIVLAYI